MRLCSVRPGVRRTWTVELRPQPGGPVLVCQQCTHGGRPLVGSAARSELLAHLAAHARLAPLPVHLRTCQCHERGCRQHPRHRGCDGPIRLLLVRERGGRRWRLSDACTACAAATSQAAVVPETTLVSTAEPSGQARARRRRCPRGPDSQTRVREMLNYLASALPEETGAGARMLALQCALRMNDSAQVRLPYGVLRSLRLGSAAGPWRELNESGLLHTGPSDQRAVAVQILDAGLLTQHPARPDRLRAADWALRCVCPARTSTPLLRLAALAFVVRTARTSDHGLSEIDHVARECGVRAAALPPLLEQLVTAGVLVSWQAAPDTGEVSWRLGPDGLHSHSASENTD
jgi:hypothetical protein